MLLHVLQSVEKCIRKTRNILLGRFAFRCSSLGLLQTPVPFLEECRLHRKVRAPEMIGNCESVGTWDFATNIFEIWQPTRLSVVCHLGQPLRALFRGRQPAPCTALSTDINISVPSDGRDCILPLLDQIFERYGRLRTGECTSASLELISWFA